jgi:hypothetical protein
MTSLYAAALTVLLLSARMSPAFAACVNAKCSDTTAIQEARQRIQSTCGCTRSGQTHGKYKKCVKTTLKAADLTALIPQKSCRKLIMKCESASICGKPNAAVCCSLNNRNQVKASIVGSASKCKGSACGALLGLFSKFDACAADGTCAGPLATTTTTTSPAGGTTTSTSTTLPSGGGVLQGALTATPGRFNYNLMLGVPGANSACNTNFPGTHACTYPELQNAQTAGDLVGLRDTAGMTVTSFWAIDPTQPPLQQCLDDVSSQQNWEYATAHTASRGQKVDLDNAAGTLGPLQSSLQCNFSESWVGCCQ